jgi:serine/threonine protein kinase
MIREDGYVKVLDFGLAKLTEPPLADSSVETQNLLSRPGIIMGTVTYMSPEQARARSIDARSDLFSFGVVLHEMLSGRVPFRGETTTDVIAEIIQSTPPPVSRYNDLVPDDMDRIVAKCLEKDRTERYQTAADLLADLKRFARRE